MKADLPLARGEPPSTRRVTLTEVGEAYHRRVAPLLEELELAAERTRETNDEPRGLVRVATPTAFAHEHVAKWIVELHALHPELRVELVLDTRLSDLVEERIDVAIRLGQVQASSVIAVKLCEMPRVVVASPEYLATAGRPRRPADLAQRACLAFPYEGYGPVWTFRDAKGRESRVEVSPLVTVPEGLVLRSLAVRGVGLALLPRWLVAEQLHDGSLVEVLPDHDATATVHGAAVWLVYPSREYVPVKVRAFLDFVKERFRHGPPWQRGLR